MPLFKVWNGDKVNKKFIVAENFTQLVAKGKRFYLYSFIFLSVHGVTEKKKKPTKFGLSEKNIFVEIRTFVR